MECFVVAETKERRKTDGLQKGNIGFNSKMNDEYGDDDVKRIVSYDISGGKLRGRRRTARAAALNCDEVRASGKAMKKRLAPRARPGTAHTMQKKEKRVSEKEREREGNAPRKVYIRRHRKAHHSLESSTHSSVFRLQMNRP